LLTLEQCSRDNDKKTRRSRSIKSAGDAAGISQRVDFWDLAFGVRLGGSANADESENAGKLNWSQLPLTSEDGQPTQLTGAVPTPDACSLALVLEHAVFFCSVNCGPSNLAQALGRAVGDDGTAFASSHPHYSNKRPISAVLPLAPALVHIPSGHVDADAWNSQLLQTVEIDEEEAVSKLLAAKTRAEFDRHFEPYVKSVSRIPVKSAVGKKRRRGKKIVMSSCVGALSQHFVHTIAEKCVRTPELKLWESLKYVILTGQISAQQTPDMVPCLIQHEQTDLLEVCLRHVADLPERSLVQVLRYFIRQVDCGKIEVGEGSKAKAAAKGKKQKGKAKGKGKEDEEEEDDDSAAASASVSVVGNGRRDVAALAAVSSSNTNSSALDRLLSLIVSAPRTDGFLRAALRSLNMEEVKMLLVYLKRQLYIYKHQLCDSNSNSHSNSGGQGRTSRPSVLQVLDWVGLLSDAHLAQIIMHSTRDESFHAAMQVGECNYGGGKCADTVLHLYYIAVATYTTSVLPTCS
jgi:hypothetical protein